MLQRGIAVQELPVRFEGDLVFQPLHFVFDRKQIGERTQPLFQNRSVLFKIRNLIKSSNLKSRSAADRTFVRFHSGTEHFQKSGLARTVSADKAYLFGGIDLKGNVSENR